MRRAAVTPLSMTEFPSDEAIYADTDTTWQQKLLLFREKRGIGKKALARLSGVSYNTIEGLDRGTGSMFVNIALICEALDVDVARIARLAILDNRRAPLPRRKILVRHIGIPNSQGR